MFSAVDLECEMKSDSSPERDQPHEEDIIKEPEKTNDGKKRKRKPYRPGTDSIKQAKTQKWSKTTLFICVVRYWGLHGSTERR